MMDLAAIERAVRGNRPDLLPALFDGATEADRKLARPLLRDLEAEERQWWEREWPSRRNRSENPINSRALDTLRLATAPTPEGAARVLRHTAFVKPSDPERAQLVLGRPPRWKAKLLDLLCTATRDATRGRSEAPWDVIDPLLADAGLRHLDTPAFALEYLRRQSVDLDADALLRVDPELPSLLLLAIESGRLDEAMPPEWTLQPEQRDPGRWAEVAASWAASGALDRGRLHHTLVNALVVGGVQPHLRAVLAFLERLSPTADEVRKLQREYQALIEAQHSASAAFALKQLRRADEAVPLEAAVVVDVCERALARTEVGTATAALAWLKALQARSPAVDVTGAVALAMAHPKRGVQDRAAALFPDAEATVVAVGGLPERPPLPPCPAMDLPQSPDELRHILRRQYRFGDEERALVGYARFGSELGDADRAELAEVGLHALAVAEELAKGYQQPGFLRGLRNMVAAPSTPRAPARPEDSLIVRAREVAAIAGRGPVTLLSTPRDLGGFVDPEALLDSLARLRAAGKRALPRDLEAAWLRLPGSAYAHDYVERVSAVGGQDAAWLAGELRRGPIPAPNLGIGEFVFGRSLVHLRAVGAWPEAQGRGGDLVALTTRLLPQLSRYLPSQDVTPEVALMPSQRDLSAANQLPLLEAEHSGMPLEGLSLLPYQEGRLGPPSYTGLALAANGEKAPMRAATLDATLGLLATDSLDGAEAGRAWAFLQGRPNIKLGRWRAHLTDVSASSVAGARYVWEVLRQVLEAGLRGDLATRSGVADLIALAADAARTVGAKGRLEGLDALADRGGKSRLVTETRRLRDALS